MANETPSRPPPFMANAILNFHFDYVTTSLNNNASMSHNCVILQQSDQVALLCQVRLAFKKPIKVEEEEVEDQEPLLE